MTDPRAPEIRFRVDPADVPPEKAARRLHLTLERFNELLPALRDRGFPAPDPDTGMYDLEAIDLWRWERHHARGALTPGPTDPQPKAVLQPGKVERFLEAKERQTSKRRGHRGIA